MNIRTFLVCILVLVLPLTACTSSTPEKMKLGILLPLTGEYASVGSEIQRGIEIANDESPRPLELIYEDVGAISPAKAITPANKLLNVDAIPIGIVADSQNAVVMGPIFSERNVPLVVLWDSSDAIIGSGKTVFSTGFSSERSADAMASYAYNTLGLRTVAIIKQQDPYSVVVADEFATRFTDLGGSVVLTERLGIDEQNFRTTILKIQSSNAQGVYFPITTQTEVSFVKQARELNLNATLLAADWFFQDTIDAAGAAAEGVYLHTIYTDDADALKQKYKTKYGQEPSDITIVGVGYTGMQTVQKAIASGKPLNEALTDVIGPSRTLARAEKVYRVENGKAVLVS